MHNLQNFFLKLLCLFFLCTGLFAEVKSIQDINNRNGTINFHEIDEFFKQARLRKSTSRLKEFYINLPDAGKFYLITSLYPGLTPELYRFQYIIEIFSIASEEERAGIIFSSLSRIRSEETKKALINSFVHKTYGGNNAVNILTSKKEEARGFGKFKELPDHQKLCFAEYLENKKAEYLQELKTNRFYPGGKPLKPSNRKYRQEKLIKFNSLLDNYSIRQSVRELRLNCSGLLDRILIKKEFCYLGRLKVPLDRIFNPAQVRQNYLMVCRAYSIKPHVDITVSNNSDPYKIISGIAYNAFMQSKIMNNPDVFLSYLKGASEGGDLGKAILETGDAKLLGIIHKSKPDYRIKNPYENGTYELRVNKLHQYAFHHYASQGGYSKRNSWLEAIYSSTGIPFSFNSSDHLEREVENMKNSASPKEIDEFLELVEIKKD